MSFLWEPLEFEFMRRALLACLFLGFTNGFLGAFIVIRRLALLADALSHSLLPGIAIAAIFLGLSTPAMLIGGLLAALFVALGGQLISRSSRLKDETAIASLYILAFAVGIVLITHARVKVDLTHFLFGNILGVGDADLWMAFGAGALTLISATALQRPILLTLFESSVARTLGIPVGALLLWITVLIVLTMVASLQAVGVLLSLGLLILPAATLYLLTDSYSLLLWGGGVLGAVGAVLGLYLSYWLNLPSGPTIVLVLGAVFLGAYLFSPKYGILARTRRTHHLHEESLQRWDSPPDQPGSDPKIRTL